MATTFYGLEYAVDYSVRTGEVYAAERHGKQAVAHLYRLVRALALRVRPNILRKHELLPAWVVRATGGPVDDIGLAELRSVEVLRDTICPTAEIEICP